jgi:hypothetical protein
MTTNPAYGNLTPQDMRAMARRKDAIHDPANVYAMLGNGSDYNRARLVEAIGGKRAEAWMREWWCMSQSRLARARAEVDVAINARMGRGYTGA